MRKIYFDVTDIVQYTESSSRVSGIQRVQVRLIRSIAQRLGGEQVRACFWHPIANELVEFNPLTVFAEVELDAGLFRARLGLLETSYFPPRKVMKKVLAPVKNSKAKKLWKKALIYLLCVFDRPKLERMGVRWGYQYSKLPPERLITVGSMAVDDVYVFLGANWSHNDVLEFGKRHRQNGGLVVQMIYDLIPFYGVEFCSESLRERFESFLMKVSLCANRFICISEWTKVEFLAFMLERGIVVSADTVPLAHEFDGYARNTVGTVADSVDVARLEARKFVLCVGTIESRKNGELLLNVWLELVRSKQPNLPVLVFAGKYGWDSASFLEILESRPDLKAYVIVLPSPSDRDLAFLYQKCLFSMYPSFYEGWGLPVGEAVWFGKYVIASNATSIPEVCGDLVDYVDPGDVTRCLDLVKQAINDPEYIRERESKIRLRDLTSWDAVADKLLDIFNRHLRMEEA